jgi:hypothetical protein
VHSTQTCAFFKRSCGNLPQWNERYRISAHHGISKAHWFSNAGLRHASISHVSYNYNSATACLVAADSVSDRQRSSGHQVAAGTAPASRLAITGLLQRRTPSLAQASPLCLVVSSRIDIPTILYVSYCSNIYHHKNVKIIRLTFLMFSSPTSLVLPKIWI